MDASKDDRTKPHQIERTSVGTSVMALRTPMRWTREHWMPVVKMPVVVSNYYHFYYRRLRFLVP
jgi:hypothetical protein